MSKRKWSRSGASIRAELERTGAEVQRSDAAWLSFRLGEMPARWSAHLRAEHTRRGGLACAVANAWLLGVTEQGLAGRLPLSASDDDLRQESIACAGDCVAVAVGGDDLSVYTRMSDYCQRRGVVAPIVCGDDVWPAVRRMACGRWWLRKLRAAHARRCEGAAIRGGVVRRGLWEYATQDQVARRGAQRKRNMQAVNNAVLVDVAAGESVPLRDIVAGSLANPANRRAEMMTRIRGADDLAAIDGHVCEFWTITAPSKFHAQRITGACAESNPHYKNTTPKEAQQYLCRVWAVARAAWARRGLRVYGLRAAEPHHDGCPHWHVVVYGEARALRFARRLLRVYALRMDGGEAGARRARFSAKPLQGGSAGASYAAKYISKNIDGFGMDGERDGETGRKISESARRVDAWAAAWGIRQFQFFGLPAIGIWRTLRRVPDVVGSPGAALESARKAADEGDFCAFCLAARRGSFEVVRRASDALTIYGDAAARRVIGVIDGGCRALLDVRQWVIEWRGASGRQAAGGYITPHGEDDKKGRGGALGLGFGVTRSGVNNCTRGAARGVGGASGFVGDGLTIPY